MVADPIGAPDRLRRYAFEIAGNLRAYRGLTFLPLRLDPALTEQGEPVAEGAHHQSFEWDPRAAPLSPDDVARSLLLDFDTGEPRLLTGVAVEMWPLGDPSIEAEAVAWEIIDYDGLWLRFQARRSPEGYIWRVDYCFRAVRCPYCGGPRLTALKTDPEIYRCDTCHDDVREESLCSWTGGRALRSPGR